MANIQITTIEGVELDGTTLTRIDFTFDPKNEILKTEISYSPVMKGKDARDIWYKLNNFNDVEYLLLEVKKLASMICGIDRYNSTSRKPNQVFFRYLVMWYAFRKLKFSIEKTGGIFEVASSSAYHGVYVIESDENELIYDQIYWRKLFMEKIRELRK